MPISDLHLLSAYWRIEPWGPWRDNAHAGVIAAAVQNVFLKKNAKPKTFLDFMLKPREEASRSRGKAFIAFLKTVAKRKPKPKP